LADYLIAHSLQPFDTDSVVSAGQTAITPAVKQLIADEVRWELNQEQTETLHPESVTGPVAPSPPILAGDQPHVFVVEDALSVDAGGQTCALTKGDVLQLTDLPAANMTTASVRVLAGKGEDCRAGATLSVKLTDLQEMENQMHQTIDKGLVELQAHRSGLPKPPSAAKGAPIPAPFAADLPPADPNVATEIGDATSKAARMEQKALDEALNTQAGPSASPGAAPATITEGQTIEQVVAILGSPQNIFSVGQKSIYLYEKMKITFLNGKVNDVQ
jgi:hypothetical protein